MRKTERGGARPGTQSDGSASDTALGSTRPREIGAANRGPFPARAPPPPRKPEGIAKWIAVEFRRAGARRSKLFATGPTKEHPIDTDAIETPSPAERFDAKEELGAIARLKMSPEQRKTVALAAEGYTAREIGQRLGIPEDTAATYLKRARAACVKARRK